MSPTSIFAMIFLLAATSVGGLLYAVLQPRLSYQRRVRMRLQLTVGERAKTSHQTGGPVKSRKRSIEDTLKEIAHNQKNKKGSRPALKERLRQSGLGWSRTTYMGLCGVVGSLAYGVITIGIGLPRLAAAGLAVLTGLVVLHLYVGAKRNQRFKAFSNEFPNAVDVIVRGVRSGLPLGDCLRVIAVEGQEPVKGEFKAIMDDQMLGVPVQDAMLRFAERMPLAESNFLATVIAIQSKSGGNLTEALANLSTVLRERKKMKNKIKALSAEAKASAAIIGSLPLAVAGVLYLSSPQYISLLVTTGLGQLVLTACAIWMIIGILVMRSMINFDF
jgi:tight adherence protein B